MKRILFLFLFLSSLLVFGQINPPDDDDDPSAIPVDGGVSLLAIAGVAWGIKKLKNNK